MSKNASHGVQGRREKFQGCLSNGTTHTFIHTLCLRQLNSPTISPLSHVVWDYLIVHIQSKRHRRKKEKKLKKVGLVAAAIIHCWWQIPININGPQNTYNAHVKTTSSPCGAVVNPPVTKTMFCHFCQNHTINVILISMAFSHLLHLFYDQANLKCVAPFLHENPPKWRESLENSFAWKRLTMMI